MNNTRVEVGRVSTSWLGSDRESVTCGMVTVSLPPSIAPYHAAWSKWSMSSWRCKGVGVVGALALDRRCIRT
jgi:hypothetical protein